MRITTDWHIHSRNSCDCRPVGLAVADMPTLTRMQGIGDFGLTDHLHTPFNLPDIAASRAEYLASNPSPRFHFGIEVSCASQWEFDELEKGIHPNPVYGIRQGGPANGPLAIGITEADIEKFGIEYVIGGTHWPMYLPEDREAIIRDYHRQNMFLATHPLVDIVAHPWWWMGYWQDGQGCYLTDPWFDDFRRIPASMHAEFAAAAVEHKTAVEINIAAMLLNKLYPKNFPEQYLEYLAALKSAGVKLSIGSDSHAATYYAGFDRASEMLDAIGITDEELWRLPPSDSEVRPQDS